MTDPVGYVTAHAHAVFGGYFPLEATGLVTTSTGPEIKPPQSNVEYCNTKSTVPLEPWVACNSNIQNCISFIFKGRKIHKDISGTVHCFKTVRSNYPPTQYLIPQEWSPQKNWVPCDKYKLAHSEGLFIKWYDSDRAKWLWNKCCR